MERGWLVFWDVTLCIVEDGEEPVVASISQGRRVSLGWKEGNKGPGTGCRFLWNVDNVSDYMALLPDNSNHHSHHHKKMKFLIIEIVKYTPY